MDQRSPARRLRPPEPVNTMSEGDRGADSTVRGDQLRGADDIGALPAGLVRLGDSSVRATAREGPPTVVRPIAHRGRVTLLHAREKAGKSTLLRAAVAAVTRGAPFLEQATIAGRVLWVGEEAVGDVKGQLLEAEADIDRVFFIRGLNPNPEQASSLPRLVALLRPVWVIIDTWQHYLKAHRVTDTAGSGAQGLLLGDIVDLAQEYEVAVTVSHHNTKNRPNEYRDSTALGAVADMIVSLGRGETPTTRRLQPSGRWHLDPLDIRWKRGVGYEVVEDAEQAEPPSRRTLLGPIDDRVLLHLLDLPPDVRPSARVLAAALRCQGRRYDEVRATLDRLVPGGFVDHAPRPGATSSRDRGYVLTTRGRLRAASLREASDPRGSTNKKEAEARPQGATVSEPASPGVAGNGNATATPAEVKEGQSVDVEAGDVHGPDRLF